MIETGITFWFVLVCAVINLGLGFLWYSPALFGREWAKLAGKQGDPLRMDGVSAPFAWLIASALAMSYALASVLSAFAPQSLYECVSIAILAWIGLSAATSVGEYVFLKKPLALFLINGGFYLLSFIIVAVLFRFWS